MLHLTILQFRELAQRNDLFGYIYFTMMPSLFLILFNENIKKKCCVFSFHKLEYWEKFSIWQNVWWKLWEHVAEK